MHRAVAYEALGLIEMMARDVRSIAATDEGFKLRYLEEASRLELEGFKAKATRIR
jgi:hypothetical protein